MRKIIFCFAMLAATFSCVVEASADNLVAASWYGEKYRGKRTASGERFNPAALTAAHPSLPFGTMVRVTNPQDGRSVVVRVNDRGPAGGQFGIDLSYAAARAIGLTRAGSATVRLSPASEAQLAEGLR